ncbi:DoxX family protein [Nocardioides sp.]|uniref:DoxX family protein n=1 Tax=Nocardioides sp. TaxID=35761 RepID=UPI00378450FF
MTVSRLIARPMLASIFVVGAATALRNTSGPADKADPVTSRLVPLARKAGIPLPEDPETLVKINAGVQVGAGLALATGRFPRLSAAVLAASLVPTTAAGHRFWEYDDATQRTQQRLHFFKNVALIGGLIIASGDTEGRPGVAWRTRHAAKDARREAKLLKAKVTG